ncbi:hypothetical protein [Sphingosinicella humi]|uniref:hypothetical protein n=1 Tax=Allosphingosinicella humi TaxID=2068657 RepID=UPI001FB1A04E|nr:hypothetical protein [Sphingosinicella humi]
MRPSQILTSAAILFAALSVPAESQTPAAVPQFTYADLVDLALAAPVVAHVEVRDAVRLRAERAVGVEPGKTRFYVEADVLSLIRGARGLPARISYLVDLPNDWRGRPPKLRKETQFILLATPVAGRPAELQLIGPDAQLPYSPELADRMRQVLRQAAQPDAPPKITGIGRAFHVPGTLPGESETQIFLETADGRPVSLTVLRRPGQAPRWAVALSEIVDNAARPPEPDTLLWYALACSLPQTLPPDSIAGTETSQAAAIRADYQVVLKGLGACVRNRGV